MRDTMRSPEIILSNLVSQRAKNNNYVVKNIYRNLFNIEFYARAYQKMYAKPGNMTKDIDNKTIDGMSIQRMENLIEKIRTEEYKPMPTTRTYIPKKNGKLRPLGIPSIEDKIVQTIIGEILEAIYEPCFSDKSHGFRPNRSCHTALIQFTKSCNNIPWVIEGDIEGFFDNINHSTLINILKKSIADERFIRLIWKFLKAGYVEDWKFNKTYSGTPQGGIISPILSNIYLNEFDTWIKDYTAKIKGNKKRQRNPEYRKLEYQIGRLRKLIRNTELDKDTKISYKDKLIKYEKEILSIPSMIGNDPNFINIQYCRYADDFVLGVNGDKKLAENIKNDIYNFLKNELKLNLSLEKTLISKANKPFKFLGYELMVNRTCKIYKTPSGGWNRTAKTMKLQVPFEAWVNKLKELEVINTTKMGNEEWKGRCRVKLLHNENVEIISRFNAEIRGLYNYYKLAGNVSVLNKFHYIMETSFTKTLAGKYNTTSGIIWNSYQIDGNLGIKYKNKNGEQKIIKFFPKKFNTMNYADKNSKVDDLPNYHVYNSSTSMLDKLSARECEWCGKTDCNIEIHHIRKLGELRKSKETWKVRMMERKRKTMALCTDCHINLHRGTLTNIKHK